MINIILRICTQPTRGHWLTDAFDDGGSDDEVEFLPAVFHLLHHHLPSLSGLHFAYHGKHLLTPAQA